MCLDGQPRSQEKGQVESQVYKEQRVNTGQDQRRVSIGSCIVLIYGWVKKFGTMAWWGEKGWGGSFGPALFACTELYDSSMFQKDSASHLAMSSLLFWSFPRRRILHYRVVKIMNAMLTTFKETKAEVTPSVDSRLQITWNELMS